MRPTLVRTHPVLTFVSGSTASNQKAQEFFCSVFSFQELAPPSNTNNVDKNDKLSQSASLGIFSGPELSSTAIQCPSTGTILHFLSLDESPFYSSKKNDKRNDHPLSLLAITNSVTPHDPTSSQQSSWESIQNARDFISPHVDSLSLLKVGAVSKIVSRHFHSTDLVTSSTTLPLIQIPSNNPLSSSLTLSSLSNLDAPSLREVVLPHTEESHLPTTLSKFPRSIHPITSKPIIGLYSYPHSSSKTASPLHLRPLPAAPHDRFFGIPSLIFQCQDLYPTKTQLQSKLDCQMEKVGFSNSQNLKGQYRIRSSFIDGMDIRLCHAHNLSSSFAEAQESLLAGSFDELQNYQVLSEGKHTTNNDDEGSNDENEKEIVEHWQKMKKDGDCWVEFRSTIKSPAGFFNGSPMMKKTNSRENQGPKVATAPNLPYE